MGTSLTDSALPGPALKQWTVSAVRPGAVVGRWAAALLDAPPRALRRVFDRVGTGLQRFDDNLWDGGDDA